MTVLAAPSLPAATYGAAEPPVAARAVWLRQYARSLIAVDLLALLLAGTFAVWLRFGDRPGHVRGVSYYAVVLIVSALWLASLALGRCYETRFLGSGPEEFRRVGNASVRLAAVVAMVCFGAKLEVARSFVAIAIPTGLALLLLGRRLARAALHRARRHGRCAHRVILVGAPLQVAELAQTLGREPLAGLRVVGACTPGGGSDLRLEDGTLLPVVGTLSTVRDALVETGADTVAVTASPGLTGQSLRVLAYELEATGVDLVVAPTLTSVTGTRVSIRPVAGLPLLHLDEPELSGARKLVKGTFDRAAAAVALVLLAPVFLALGLAVAATSRGPVLFRQLRVGRDGRTFCVWKFRSMYADAEQRRSELQRLNEHDGVLFKIRNDPRITPVGARMRKYSLDELPQLVNVLRGQMSLVGPRPPLPSEVERYEGHAHRRLLVKPGLTGLWQVSGRSDLTWDESVRLDLEYVENWTLGLDLLLLAKTVVTVVKARGAY